MPKQKNLLMTLFLIYALSSYSQNMINTSSWIEGSSATPSGFSNYGTVSTVNTREAHIGPDGLTSVVTWTANPTDQNDLDGGFTTDYFNIDHTKTYRLTVWIKKVGSDDGTTYFGMYSKDVNGNHSSLYLSGGALSNPYFFIGDLPTSDEWYLLVAFAHNSSYQGDTQGGIYNTSGVKVLDISRDFMFSTAAQTLLLRTFLYQSNTLTDKQLFYDPRMEVVDGTEPSISDLATNNNNGGNTGGTTSSAWAESGENVTLQKTGNVGIGINNPTEKVDILGNLKVQGDLFLNSGSLIADGLQVNNTIKLFSSQSSGSYEIGDTTSTTGNSYTIDYNDSNGITNQILNQGQIRFTQKFHDDVTSFGADFTSFNFLNNSGQSILDFSQKGQAITFKLPLSSSSLSIGTDQNDPGYSLTVKGKIHVQEVKVDLLGAIAPDYVFYEDYNLRTLEEVQSYIIKEGHLPNIPSATEMEVEGVNLKEMNLKLLEKVEELTLYTIAQEKAIKKQQQKNDELEKRLQKLEKSLNK